MLQARLAPASQLRHKMAACHRPLRHLTRARASHTSEEPHLQLATANLPSATDVSTFVKYMYSWASTLTSSGANYPFALPLKADKLADDAGFQISLQTTTNDRRILSAADITSTVEPVNGKNVLFVRLYEGPGAMANRRSPPPADPKKRLEVVLDSLVDIPIIMQTMPKAIRQAVQVASSSQ